MKAGWRWAAAVLATGAVWTGCTQEPNKRDVSEQNNPGLDSPKPETPQDNPPTAPPAPMPDAPTPVPDTPTPVPDTPPTPTTPPPPPEAAIDFPTVPGWTFYGTQHGGPRRIYGVSADEGGNVWVAGGEDGLFVLRPGATTFQRFTMEQGLRPYGYMPDGSAPMGEKYLKVISVAGGPADTVFVGYEGRPGKGDEHCENNWDGSRPDPSRYKSGDADKVTLRADGSLQVVHYDIFSGPGIVAAEMRGREKLCSILRIAYDKNTQSVWFGGNHGFARGDANYQGNPTCNGQLDCSGVMEHVHPAINAYPDILLTDAYYGVSVHSSGDVLFGGANRSTRFLYGTTGNDYWEAQSRTEDSPYVSNRIDIWPDLVGEGSMPKPAERDDDNVSAMSVVGDTVWVSSFTKGLARMNVNGGDVQYVSLGEKAEKALTAVEARTADGSVWVGARWLGIVYRLQGGAVKTYSCSEFGRRLCSSRISDIKADGHRVLVAFLGSDENHVPGALGIYTGH
ncbi:hypothetical protein F0U62_10070 [Cystobacter fuscus]|nr:hypothetical protein F0U62_10070 [Cystobacter fuscus]